MNHLENNNISLKIHALFEKMMDKQENSYSESKKSSIAIG